ncbi:MAG: DPP IV N-terminal domain-containing protein [Gemmatimonadales bacterium]
MMQRKSLGRSVPAALALLALATVGGHAQDRLKTMPGYEQYTKMASQINGSVKSGAINATWVDSGKALQYNLDGKLWRFDLATKKASEATTPGTPATQPGRGPRGAAGAPGRGRQATTAASPDGKRKAIYRDRNLFVADSSGSNEVALTTDGNEKDRIKYGTASWVYGEELGQQSAMWWNPSSTRLAYYRFDEKPVPDYYLQLNQTKIQSSLDVEAYPKAGVDNPVVDIFVYDLAAKKSVKLDIRDGKPWSNDVVGHYVYNVNWSPDGTELLVNRTNRRQQILEFAACSPETAKCRVIIHEEWPTGWVENTPQIRWLEDNKRFIWESERNGFKNYYLYDISGKLLNPITTNQFESVAIVRVDEKAKTLWYTARDGDNYMKVQLHRVGLDGRKDIRLTDPAFTHTVNLSPDAKYFTDVAQTHDQAPVSRLRDANGKLVSELTRSDLSKFESLGLKKVEMFTYLAADGKTKLHGMISFPSNFDPNKKYPILVPVYGGPASAGSTSSEQFRAGNPQAEYGFLIVNLDTRATPGQGKRTLDDLYLKLGQTEMDDMAEGIKALWSRPYVDKARVGIHGTSYGGYSSVMELLRHPDVFTVAAAQSPVTSWDHYDTIYTERYMWIPEENKEGYEKGSAMKYVDQLKGRLMLYYGTADDNVHPNNMMQLIQALQKAGKSFEVQVGPDQGHSAMNQQRMMEFFIENLVLRNPTIS